MFQSGGIVSACGLGGGDDFLLFAHIQPCGIVGIEPLRVLADECALFAKAFLFGCAAVIGLYSAFTDFIIGVCRGFQAACWPFLAKHLRVIATRILGGGIIAKMLNVAMTMHHCRFLLALVYRGQPQAQFAIFLCGWVFRGRQRTVKRLRLRVFTDVARGFGNVLPFLFRHGLFGHDIGFFGNAHIVFLRIHACNAGGRRHCYGIGFKCSDRSGFDLVDRHNSVFGLKHIFCLCHC